jgi:hypothetical protein
MVTESSSRLRPLSFGDILDTVFRLYRNNFLTMIGIVAILQIPIVLLQVASTFFFGAGVVTDIYNLLDSLPAFDPTSQSFAELPIANITSFLGIAAIIGLVEAIVLQPIISGAVVRAVSDRYHQRTISLGKAYDYKVTKMLSLIASRFLIAILVIMALVVASLIFFLISFFFGMIASVGGDSVIGLMTGLVGMLGILGSILFAAALVFIVWASFLFVDQAIVLEDNGPIDGIVRSWRLFKGSMWRVVGIMLVTWLLLQVLTFIPGLLMSFVTTMMFGDSIELFSLKQNIDTIVTYTTQILVLPFLLGVYTVLYYDLRVRKEGYDLEMAIAEPYESPVYPYETN